MIYFLMTNYHWNGGADVRSRALLHDSQLLRRDTKFLRERVFDFLKQDQPQLPKSCLRFLQPLKKTELDFGAVKSLQTNITSFSDFREVESIRNHQ